MHSELDSYRCSVCGVLPSNTHLINKAGPEENWNQINLCVLHYEEMCRVGVLTFVRKYPLVDKLLLNKGWIRLLGKLWHHNSIKEQSNEKDSKKSSKKNS